MPATQKRALLKPDPRRCSCICASTSFVHLSVRGRVAGHGEQQGGEGGGFVGRALGHHVERAREGLNLLHHARVLEGQRGEQVARRDDGPRGHGVVDQARLRGLPRTKTNVVGGGAKKQI